MTLNTPNCRERSCLDRRGTLHVRDFLRDEQLQRMLVAADLVRPAPAVSADDGLAQLVRSAVEADALVLPLAEEAQHGEVVTRATIGAVLVKWYARQ